MITQPRRGRVCGCRPFRDLRIEFQRRGVDRLAIHDQRKRFIDDHAGPRFAWDVEACVRHSTLGDIKLKRHEVILQRACLSLDDGFRAAWGALIGVVEFDGFLWIFCECGRQEAHNQCDISNEWQVCFHVIVFYFMESLSFSNIPS